jgi:predicted phosphate transport protein (TIGR00153 family)
VEGAVPFQVIPRETRFFDLFDEAAENVLAGARELVALVDDLPNAGVYAANIQELEHVGDDLTHRIFALLNTTFVVPIDRHDIHHLASSLDDVLDAQEAVADLLTLHRLQEALPQFRQQVHVLQRAVEAVRVAIRGLRTLRHVDTAIATIKREEHEGDWLYRRCLAELYSGNYRPMEVLRWQDLLHQTEAAIDRCEDIANTIESVVLKHA